MARYPGAIWDPLGPQTEPRMRSHDIVCLHTMAGSLAGTDSFFRAQGYGGLESHFGLGRTVMKQWQDILFEADANLDGNDRVISVETADRGEGFPVWSGSDVPAWSLEQVDELVEFLLWVTSKEAHRDCPASWLCHQAGIPRALIPDTQQGRRGIGYHRQGIDPWRHPNGERWSKATGKVCPGARRIHQLTTVIIPRVQAATAQPPIPVIPEEDDMVIVITAPNRPPRAVVQGKLIGFSPDPAGGSQYTDFRAAVDKAHIPVADWKCDVVQYDAVSALYSPPATES